MFRFFCYRIFYSGEIKIWNGTNLGAPERCFSAFPLTATTGDGSLIDVCADSRGRRPATSV